MCGICGFINRDPSEPASTQLLGRMAGAIAHRGPDGQGVFAERYAGLGHRRLTIMDTSEAAGQPMRNEAGTVWITFNGEIYNYLDLRHELLSCGHTFLSQSDTEVILHLYEELGPRCVEKLRGMFAFAIWDSAREQLVLARDRLGKKPLYYTQTDQRFLFASEIKALWQDETVERTIHLPALHHYLSLGYIPGPQTAFKNVFCLPPAHILVLRSNTIHLERYWQFTFEQPTKAPDIKQTEVEILQRIQEAVALRLASAVPVGVMLSGGLDSSLLVAIMARLDARPIQTFSVSLPGRAHDEAPYARQVAELFKTEHHEFAFTPDLAEWLPQVAAQFDEPFGDSSALPTYYLAKMLGQQVTVALNGDGGDEDFAGYDRYGKDQWAAFYLKQPASMRRAVAGLMQATIPGSAPTHGLARRLQNFAAFNPPTAADRYYRWVSIFQEPDRQALFTSDFLEAQNGQTTEALIAGFYNAAPSANPTEAALYTDIHTYLADDLLVKMDRATMAFGVEARSPFLDHEFVAYAAGLPIGFKNRHLTRKWILKQAAQSLLPKAIVERPKRGFGLPVGEWLRGPLRPMLYDVLTSQTARQRGYFNTEAVTTMLTQHQSGQANWQFHLWNLLMLELWQQTCVDVARPPIATATLAVAD